VTSSWFFILQLPHQVFKHTVEKTNYKYQSRMAKIRLPAVLITVEK